MEICVLPKLIQLCEDVWFLSGNLIYLISHQNFSDTIELLLNL